MDTRKTLANDAYRLEVRLDGNNVFMTLTDLAMGFDVADGPYAYRASRACDEGSVHSEWLLAPSVHVRGDSVTVKGALAGLELTHRFRLPGDRAVAEERISLRNPTGKPVRLEGFSAGLTRRIADHYGAILPELRTDLFVPIPFRRRANEPGDAELSFADLLRLAGRAQRANEKPLSWPMWGSVPAPGWASEGWAWERGERALGIFKLNQEGMEQSIVATETDGRGVALRFGGAASFAEEPSALRFLAPGQSIELGVTRYQTVANDRREAWYAFRGFLDENGCRYPEGFDPPVHWNELYDNPEWNLGSPGTPPKGPTRQVTYTRALLEEEAAKAVEYGCQSLYLDPGWDTAFGTFLWGEEWLGPRREFIDQVRTKYGLGVSLHCPLATWMSIDGRGASSWPREAYQAREDGTVVEGAVCLGSRQYLAEAEKRLGGHCDDGVVFLMFDGNWWNGGCWNTGHGHPVPYSMEDHVRAQVDLARRIHARNPRVIIEMHDMVMGGVMQRHTPVYYKHGLPGSYDENWGFELMWQPMEDILSGRARSLYWYNLGCNVPVYLHVDLRDDNEHCLVLWWYASTCRHLGIGGTHGNPHIAEEQKRSMRTYRRLEKLYKRGTFYGMHEEAHVHALPAENAFVVNLFNLSDQARVVEGSISLTRMGLDPDRWYVAPRGGRFDRQAGTFVVGRRMAAWSAQVVEVRSIETRPGGGG